MKHPLTGSSEAQTTGRQVSGNNLLTVLTSNTRDSFIPDGVFSYNCQGPFITFQVFLLNMAFKSKYYGKRFGSFEGQFYN